MAGTEGEHGMQERIEELEVHAAFQARTIEELELVLREFCTRVERLERELRELRAQLDLPAAATTRVDDDSPSTDETDERDVG